LGILSGVALLEPVRLVIGKHIILLTVRELEVIVIGIESVHWLLRKLSILIRYRSVVGIESVPWLLRKLSILSRYRSLVRKLVLRVESLRI
jgi:hypothetical protein